MWVTLDILETFNFVITYPLVGKIGSGEKLVESGYTVGGYLAIFGDRGRIPAVRLLLGAGHIGGD